MQSPHLHLYSTLINEFRETIQNMSWSPLPAYEEQFLLLMNSLQDDFIQDADIRYKNIIQLLCKKLNLNNEKINIFINNIYFFSKKTLNYHQKNIIMRAFNENNIILVKELLSLLSVSNTAQDTLLNYFTPIQEEQVIQLALKQVQNDKNKQDILCSLWGGYLYMSFNENRFHKYMLKSEDDSLIFFDFLTKNYSKNLERNLALGCLKIDAELINSFGNDDIFIKKTLLYVNKLFNKLSNHCYISILIKKDVNPYLMWELYSKIVIYAEKFIQSIDKKGYFHPNIIAQETKNHIQDLEIKNTDFSISNEGFAYKDCFVLTPSFFENGKNEKSFENYDILIVLEKNERDETIIPCPTCRSKNVRGNSYPVLGVKSWECQNLLCPDRSKYNRGKRYSLASLIKQEAIDNEKNKIDNVHIKKWRLDVANVNDDFEVLELLFKHYTLYNDTIELVNFNSEITELFGRKIKHSALNFNQNEKDLENIILPNTFFNRFMIDKKVNNSKKKYLNISNIENTELYCGDCFDVLSDFPESFFEGVITSPPYYNAKEYSQWSNIYCYLYDMYNIAKQIFRTMKDGSPFLFNIFDYFDNENIVTFSAMGNKRMILGSYFIEIFERVGFQIVDNIIWYKGEVQGKRNFNQGNNSPYYQAPLNSYEHILLFSKKEPKFKLNYPKIAKIRPVIKIIKGKNILGHDAPYPLELPDLLLDLIPQNSYVLDPFAGSMTTALRCLERGYKSFNIEYKEDYCKLGLKLLQKRKKTTHISLFS